jgi:hypothetical protein
MENDLLIFYKKRCATHVLFNQRNGRKAINIDVNKGLLGEGSSIKMNLSFDHAKKNRLGFINLLLLLLFCLIFYF